MPPKECSMHLLKILREQRRVSSAGVPEQWWLIWGESKWKKGEGRAKVSLFAHKAHVEISLPQWGYWEVEPLRKGLGHEGITLSNEGSYCKCKMRSASLGIPCSYMVICPPSRSGYSKEAFTRKSPMTLGLLGSRTVIWIKLLLSIIYLDCDILL